MCKSLAHLNCDDHSGRKVGATVRLVVLLTVWTLSAIFPHHALAQSKLPVKSSLCTRDNALEIIQQQVELTKTFNDAVRRITVLIRAADLLWPHEQQKARAVFTEAFDLATENEKVIDAKGPQVIILRMQVPDQRHLVVRAVARRDAAWARELTRQMVKPPNDSEISTASSSFENDLAGTRLLDSANKLIDTDINAALDFARVSLTFPASFGLTRFLYRLAEMNQQTLADQFYAQALAVYGDKPLRQLLYLQAYPFGWSETVNTPVFSFHQVPANFVRSQSLQRQFLQVLLRRVQLALETQLDEGDVYRDQRANFTPGTYHLLEGLVKLEPQVRTSLPDLLPMLTEAREKLLVSLSVETQKLLVQPGREISDKPSQSFDEQLEAAEKVPDVNERDGLIITALFGDDAAKESLGRILSATDKVSDSKLRGHLLEWLYFHRTTAAIKNKQFDEADKLASKVEGLDQRAFLHIEIAKGLLNKGDTPTRGREVLDEAIAEAKKAGNTLFAARTLLTASHLYSKIDRSQSVSILADAISCTNRIETPDFSSDDQSLENKPTRRGRGGQHRGHYSFRFYMPGFDPASAFREMAKLDFDTALSQSPGLTDKFQRALATLSVAEVCLQQLPKEKPKPNTRP
jgi:hypothetical protein